MHHRFRLLPVIGALVLCAPAVGAQVQSLEAITQAAVAKVRSAAPKDARVQLSVNPLDSRLRLAACASPLKTSLPGRGRIGSYTSVQVSCTGPRPWSIRVSVAVKMFRKVLVTTHPLARNDRIGAGDVTLAEKDVARLAYGYVGSLNDIKGRALVRPLSAGTVLTPNMLAHRQLIKRGDTVMLTVQAGPVQVRASGVALAGGDRGDHVTVRNTSSGKAIQALVTGVGTAQALP